MLCVSDSSIQDEVGLDYRDYCGTNLSSETLAIMDPGFAAEVALPLLVFKY